MSKFTRSQLKDLVKECLVEILSEGLAPGGVPLHERRVEATPAPQRRPAPTRAGSPALNSVVFGSGAPAKRPQRQTASSKPRIVDNIGSLTSDPVMSQIFADTASTTLQEQIQAEAGRPGGPSMTESVSDPNDLFEGSENWATLAFADAPRRS